MAFSFKDIRFLIHHLRQSDIHLYEALDTLNSGILSLSQASSVPIVTVSGGGSGVSRVRYTFTADTNVNVTVGTDAALMILEILQNATGGWLLTFGANFEAGLDTTVGNLPSQLSTSLFYSDGTKWRLLAGWEIK